MSGASQRQCALYLRVSTTRQADEGNSLTTQEALLLRYAKQRGYAVADLYVDAGLSGKDMNRPELQRLLDDARSWRFDVVLVWKVDRISRSMKDLLDLIAQLRENGVEFAAVDQSFDTSDPVGLLTLHILGSFAQFERELLVERSREGHLYRLQKRDWSCGPVPIGYRKVDGNLVEEPTEARLVRRIFDLFLKLKSRRAVARQLNAESVTTPQGKTWSGNRITAILKNPVYTGANVYDRHRKGDTRLRPEEEWTVVPGVREPLVEPETFEAAKAMMDKTAPDRECQSPQVYLLSGLVRCGKCLSPMCGSSQRRNGKVYRYYKCNAYQHRGKDVCTGTTVRADTLEERVLVKAREVASGCGRALAAPAQEASREPAREKARTELDRVKSRMGKVFDLYEMGQIDKAVFQARMGELALERDALADAMASERVEQAPPPPVKAGPQALVRAVVREVTVKGATARVAVAEMLDDLKAPGVLNLTPECDADSFGGRLRQWRLRAGLTQRQVAERLGVDVCSVRNWESGRFCPSEASTHLINRCQAKTGGDAALSVARTLGKDRRPRIGGTPPN